MVKIRGEQLEGDQFLQQKIMAEIAKEGPIPFARFMSLALYDQEYGYYMTANAKGKERIGWKGDYYTAPDVHPLLAHALVRQVEEVDESLGHPPCLTVVEMGGGKGLMARDFLMEYERVKVDVSRRLQYVMIERSPAMQAIQREQVQALALRGWHIRWVSRLEDMASREVTGVLFSNELLDAFPVHRIKKDGGNLREIFVDYNGDGFCERLEPPSTKEITDLCDAFMGPLPDGYTTEVNVDIGHWMREVSRILHRGVVLTIDYGHTQADYYHPARKAGTFLCYHRHHAERNPYIRVGEQDMTAHVNFSAVAEEGIRAGLAVTGFTNLMSFLIGLGAEEMLSELDQESDTLLSARELLRPQGMGGIFKVLAQHKGMVAPAFRGLRFQPFFEGILGKQQFCVA